MKRVSTAVWHEKYKRWQINVQKDGKRRSFYSSAPGRNGQRECHRKADAWLDDCIADYNVKADALFSDWLEELKLTTSKSHWRIYESFWNNWIKKGIAHLRINAINEQHLQHIINAAYRKGLSKKTLSNIRACLASFFKYCRKRNVSHLIVENVSIPKNAPRGERTILQPDDMKKLFSIDTTKYRGKVLDEPLVNAFRFEVTTGLRPGELIGLKWCDIDLEKRIISVRRAINTYKEETTGKNDNARRTFELTETAYNVLLVQKIRCYKKSDYIFQGNKGKSITQRSYYDAWIRYRAHAGIVEATPYELRHTFISIVKSLPVGLIKPLVGHSVNMDTYGTYGHLIDGELSRTARLVNQEFASICLQGIVE